MKKLVLILVCTLILLTVQQVKSESGTVDITVLNPPYEINITYPLNATYTTTSLYLNVTSNFTPNTWWYKLTRINNNEVINSSVIFTPNTTLVAVSGSNNLTLYANDSYNRIFTDEITYHVTVPNSAPQIKNLANEIFVCEDSSLSGNIYFNATDTDGDNVTVTFNQTDLFFLVIPASHISPVQVELATTRATNKSDIGTYRRIVQATDEELAATQQTNITVIEINHAPAVSAIPVHTIYLNNTQNNTFYYEIQIRDTDHGDQTSGNFSYNITFLNGNLPLNITSAGIMNFTPNNSHIGTYNISVNVTDVGLSDPHAQIQVQCGQSGLNMSSNVTFQLTISNQSTTPYFTSYYPTSLTHTAPGTPAVYFNISTRDNETTLPDAYWYVDGVFQELDQLSNTNEFSHDFGCGISGSYTVKVEITDGIFNASLQWAVTATLVACPAASTGGGGGGGGTVKTSCQEKWGCYDWKNCQNAERTFLIGLLDETEYNKIKDTCENNGWDDNTCGFQLRDCFDVNACNSILNRPNQLQECYFTINPNCNDGIKNCHDGSCELLIDCGGPCEPCPTCTDGIQNQGEEDTDCGGPCGIFCSPEKPLLEKPGIKFTLYIILAALVVVSIIKLISFIKTKNKFKAINKSALKLLFFLISIIFLASLAASQCFPEYQCGDWSACNNSFQIRICEDKICNNPDLIERTTCINLVNIPEERQIGTTWTYVEEINATQCKSQIQCSPWSDCTYTEKITNILKETINYGGHKERTCEDLADCIPTFTERGQCEKSFPIIIEKVYDDNQAFLLASDAISKQPIAKISIDSWKSKKLDIVFIQEKTILSSDCFNGVKDNNEEKTDCGGECKPCEITKAQLPYVKIIISLWILSLAFIISFIIQSFPIKKIYFKYLKKQI